MSDEYDPSTHLAISKFDLAPYPIAADGSNSNTTLFYTDCAVMSANSTHPREALLWLNFLSHQWFMFDKSRPSETNNIPARPSVAEDVGFWRTLPTAAEPAVRYGLEHGLYQYPDYKTTKEVFGALEQAIIGKTSLLSALQNANTRIAAKSALDTNLCPPTRLLPTRFNRDFSTLPVVHVSIFCMDTCTTESLIQGVVKHPSNCLLNSFGLLL